MALFRRTSKLNLVQNETSFIDLLFLDTIKNLCNLVCQTMVFFPVYELIRANSNCIFCDFCKLWVHPSCNLLNSNDFKKLTKDNSDEAWSCLKCNSEIFPFQSDNTPLFEAQKSQIFSDVNSHIETSFSNNVDDEDERFTNCKYYEYNSFNSTLEQLSSSDLTPNFSYFHLNTCSLPKNIDNINILLNSLNIDFDVLGFSETRLSKYSITPILKGYRGFHNLSSSNAGGTSLYISNSLTVVVRSDLSNLLFLESKLESTFVEILDNNRKNTIVGCIYKHPNMPIPEFINLYLKPFFEVAIKQKQKLILMGDFNIDLLKCESNHLVDDFLDELYSNFLQPSITIPTRISNTSKTLIDNIFTSNPFTKYFSDQIVSRHTPNKKLSKKQLSNRNKPWVTRAILKYINIRNNYYKKLIKAKNQEKKLYYQNQYKFYRNRIVNLIRNSKSNYYKEFFLINKNNSRKIWKGIKDILNNKDNNSRSSTSSLKINDKIISEKLTVANAFNEHFTSVADKIRNQIPHNNTHFSSYLKNNNSNSLFFNPVTIEEVLKIINNLDLTKASGPNSVPNLILKQANIAISAILTKLFNLSLQQGVFPNILKMVSVIPIYKNKGTKHSTTHALISLTETIRQNLDNCKFACGIFIDLQKAFDTVSHEILLSKLEHYGIRGVTNSWFRSYLSDRVQYISLTNTKSKKLFIKHGVPQGSVLGPILFLLYINDLINSIIFSEIFHFADDTCMLYANHNLKKMQKHLNIDLKCIYKWLTANKIALNVAKTEVILFRQRNKAVNYDIRLKLNGKKLEFSSHVRYLGILIDEFLDWDFHISYIGNKLRKTNGALCKLRYYVPKDILLSIYHALFSSHISYSPQVWGLTSKSCRIFRLQKAALRIITFSKFNSPSNPIFLNLNILTLSDLIKFLNIILTFNIINLHSPGNICDIFKLVCHSSNHSTRSKSIKLLARPSCHTAYCNLLNLYRWPSPTLVFILSDGLPCEHVGSLHSARSTGLAS
ncbi:uncharacterized protein LOC130653679 [Hydractinia symbiolongicarpus]|uniref:uncharacterized protein LOC130653679 n=1 Tax=Hydractinia symbiolongicarpus TaxID=13093 RepID=UPI002550FF40|nr:uncharacterized protein LOC130653679 [Hydractinia symbiolongicarpus]